MPYTKILVHLVWATKKRDPSIRKEIRRRLIEHIRANASEKGIFILMINCHCDHVHCLMSLGMDQTVSKIVQLIKGDSSRWINQQKLISTRFAWQSDYFAVSVSESGERRVIEYIRNQEEHHRKKMLQDEHREFIKVYGFKDLNLPPAFMPGIGILFAKNRDLMSAPVVGASAVHAL